jgi:ACS family tartrate transporter-like MFS transporter
MEDIETRVIGKGMRRLIPFLILCYFVAYLDRVNVSFAKLHMDQALGFSEAAFGLGAGLFFIAYFLFEVPSNIFLERVGARLWIARIMISWGIVSGAFAFIPSIAGATGVSNEGVLYPPIVAWRMRGRFLPRHHLLWVLGRSAISRVSQQQR